MKKEILFSFEPDEKVMKKVVDKIIKGLSDEDRAYMIEHRDPYEYHFTLGMYIRNKFIRNKKTFEGCALDADDLSVMITERVISELIEQENRNRIRNFVSKYPWTFAKTYADFAPHEYYVRDKLDEAGKKEFVWFVEYIRDYGFNCKFGKQIHIYYELDGHYYWTMGDPIEETIILNRCNVGDYDIVDGSMIYKLKRL